MFSHVHVYTRTTFPYMQYVDFHSLREASKPHLLILFSYSEQVCVLF